MKKINRKRLFVEQEQILFEYIKQMNNENYEEIFSKMYMYVKEVTGNYYLGDEMHDYFYCFFDHLLACEEKFECRKSLFGSFDLDYYDEDNFMDRLVYKTRSCLITDLVLEGFRGEISDIDFTNKCMIASSYVSDFCKEDGVLNYNLKIYPGYDASERLFEGSGYHYANIIKYRGEYYLVDVTYPQFFYSVRENLDRLGIVDFSCCNVGTFVLMEEERLTIAKSLLNDGYVKLDEQTLKNYLDPFTISFRNGLFYESTRDFSYTTEYLFDDYIRFLLGEDSQVRHEGLANIGYQKRPLKDSQLDFRKR